MSRLLEKQARDELEQDMKLQAKLELYGPCDRCGPGTPRDPEAQVADFFQDHYMGVCTDCAEELHAIQATMIK